MVIDTPSKTVAYRDGSIKVGVKIKVLMKSSIIGNSGFTGGLTATCSQKGLAIFQRNMRIVDQTILEIDFRNDLKLIEIVGPQSFNLKVDFLDDATNKTFSALTSFRIEMSDFFISIVHSPQFFKPGIPYSFTLVVSKVNGYPVLDSDLPIEVTVKDDDGFTLLSGNFSLDPSTGGIEIETSGISITAASLNIKAKYDRVKYSHKVFKTPITQEEFISINVLTPRFVT